jgi:hypothetical protein
VRSAVKSDNHALERELIDMESLSEHSIKAVKHFKIGVMYLPYNTFLLSLYFFPPLLCYSHSILVCRVDVRAISLTTIDTAKPGR